MGMEMKEMGLVWRVILEELGVVVSRWGYDMVFGLSEIEVLLVTQDVAWGGERSTTVFLEWTFGWILLRVDGVS